MTAPASPPVAVGVDTSKRLYGHYDYTKDPDGLDRIRQSLLETADWHDRAPINCNSLARLLDTIETLRALASPVSGDGSLQAEDRPSVPTCDGAADVLADAERFRALMRCGRIKMQGSSGVDAETGERNGNNVHFGAEFWPDAADVDMQPRYERSTRWGRACLRALADAILEHEAASVSPGMETLQASECTKHGEGDQ